MNKKQFLNKNIMLNQTNTETKLPPKRNTKKYSQTKMEREIKIHEYATRLI